MFDVFFCFCCHALYVLQSFTQAHVAAIRPFEIRGEILTGKKKGDKREKEEVKSQYKNRDDV